MKVGLLGDLHGDMRRLEHVLKTKTDKHDYIIQLGDFGFSDDWAKSQKLENLDKLRVVGGNHDDYNWIEEHKPACYLGDFGVLDIIPDRKVFFVRGAYSIDKEKRILDCSWWPQEELRIAKGYECWDLYSSVKPDIVLSHDCPQFVAPYYWLATVNETTRTRQLLEALYFAHQPKLWFFGHYHTSKQVKQFEPTIFRCVGINELVTLDLDTLKWAMG